MAKMDELIVGFSKQLKDSLSIGDRVELNIPAKEYRNIVATGLGGSGIGADLVYEFVGNELKVPFFVNKGYFMPSFVDKHSLVICSSYSGNTEETLSAFNDALKAGAEIVCISSGGKLIELAKEHGLNHIIVPGGNPPRSMLGYSLVQQLFVLHAYGLITKQFEIDLNTAIALLDAEEQAIRTEAKSIAAKLQGTVPVVYVNDTMTAVGIRFRQQINENSKMLSWSSPVPEMNHNELVGWRNDIAPWGTVFLRNEDDYPRNQQRIELSKEIAQEHSKVVLEIWSKGTSHIEKALYLIHLTDWVSQYLGELNGVDVVEVKVIDRLKGALAKV